MKKKIPVIICICIMISFCTFCGIRQNQSSDAAENTNPSRRDGEGSALDDDLLAVTGSSSEVCGDGISGDTGITNKLDQSIIVSDSNVPVADNVDVVRTIIIPEAVTIADGDSDLFFAGEDFKDVIPADNEILGDTQLPEKYDLREVDGKCYVTEPSDQGYTYLCWAYAAAGAMEGDILRHNEDVSYKDTNLSEKHIAYYNMHPSSGSLNGYIDDDYRTLIKPENPQNDWIFDYDTGYVAVGGVTDFCISLLTAWKGPVADEGDDSFVSLYGQDYIFRDNTSVPSSAYSADYHVQDVLQINCSEANRDLVKRMVMEHGGATIGVNADSEFFKNHNKNLYSYFGGETVPTANHEVLIIGWDDNYSAENFGKKPEGDGAFICKNSWGAGSGDNGFFYLSYYDETVMISNAASYDLAKESDEDWYDNNYQVAGFLTHVTSTLDDALNNVNTYSSAKNPYGILYEAAGHENLKAVGVMSLDMYQQYEIEVYINPDKEGDNIKLPSSEKADFIQKVSAISGGYHTFELEKEIELQEGDEFFVLIRPVTKGRLIFELQEDFVSAPNYDEWNNLTGCFNNSYKSSGRSYYISDDGTVMEKQTDKDFFVKAYTVNAR